MIRMGLTAFKFVIWEGKSAVLRSEISFYGDAKESKQKVAEVISLELSGGNSIKCI